jgi:hypothetical protein
VSHDIEVALAFVLGLLAAVLMWVACHHGWPPHTPQT